MAERIRLQAGDLAVELAPTVGGSVSAFTLAGTPVFRESPADLRDANDSGCYPLVPFSNRVRDGRFSFSGRNIQLSPNLLPQKHPLHGQGWRSAWRVEASDEARATLVFDHPPGEWPWSYQARQLFDLDDRGLTVRLHLGNTDAGPMPCGLGLHPWFPADADTVLDTAVSQVWTTDDEILPVRREPASGRYDLRARRINGAGLDNGFEGWSGSAELRWPGRRVGLRALEASRFQVYAPIEGGVVVAEPVTNANAAFNQPEARWRELGVTVLEPGDWTSLNVRFNVERAP